MLHAAGWLIILSGFVAGSHTAPAADLATGRKIYLDRCKVCHGVKGDGKSFAANALHPPPKNFTSAKSKKELTLERMIRSVTEGRDGTAMMPWENNLTAGEIRAVVHYIRRRLMTFPD